MYCIDIVGNPAQTGPSLRKIVHISPQPRNTSPQQPKNSQNNIPILFPNPNIPTNNNHKPNIQQPWQNQPNPINNHQIFYHINLFIPFLQYMLFSGISELEALLFGLHYF